MATCSRTSPSEGQWAEIDATEQGVGWVDVSWIGGQWEAWQSRCHFLMGSLCFDTWLAHSDGTIIQDHEADFESGYLISALIQITQRSVSPLKCGYRKLSWLCDPHLVTQLSQVDGLGPSCPTIFAALCFLQRSETGQCTVGPWGPLQTGRFRDVQGGDLQRGYHGHLLWHARLHCSGGEYAHCLSSFGNPGSPAAPSERQGQADAAACGQCWKLTPPDSSPAPWVNDGWKCLQFLPVQIQVQKSFVNFAVASGFAPEWGQSALYTCPM